MNGCKNAEEYCRRVVVFKARKISDNCPRNDSLAWTFVPGIIIVHWATPLSIFRRGSMNVLKECVLWVLQGYVYDVEIPAVKSALKL